MPPEGCLLWLGLAALLGLFLGVAGCYLWICQQERRQLRYARQQAAEIRAQAEKEAESLRQAAELRVREEWLHKWEAFHQEVEQTRSQLREQERRLERREDSLAQQQQHLLQKEGDLQAEAQRLTECRLLLERRQQEVEALAQAQTRRLEELAGLTREQARQLLLEQLDRELTGELAARIQQHEEQLRRLREQKAREILATAIQRYAAEYTAETTVSTIDIPSEDMKGRIIGREGRNIRAFEKATGVDVIIDDTPGVVVVSAFDSVRREIARLALIKLIQDGRIHPSRIEEVVEETRQALEQHIYEAGRQAVEEVNIGPVSEQLIQLLGRLKFRTSYSQNVLQHSIEVAHLCGLLAGELGLNDQLARRCGLLHDIGKAADHEMEGGHPQIGAELARRYGETHPEVLHAIARHHEEADGAYPYTVLVAAADAISAARPGARRETLEKYIKRLEELEAVAQGFPGVEQAYAIQAGRELRVLVDASQVSDSEAIRLCRDIARAIEEQLNYPGEIKVTVLRELRAVEFAR